MTVVSYLVTKFVSHELHCLIISKFVSSTFSYSSELKLCFLCNTELNMSKTQINPPNIAKFQKFIINDNAKLITIPLPQTEIQNSGL